MLSAVWLSPVVVVLSPLSTDEPLPAEAESLPLSVFPPVVVSDPAPVLPPVVVPVDEPVPAPAPV